MLNFSTIKAIRDFALACVAIFVGLLAGCASAPPQVEPEIGRKVAEDFLQLLATNRVDEAWESTSAEFKSDEGREQFRTFVKQHPALRKPLEFVSHELSAVNDLPRVQFYFAPDNQTAGDVRVRLVLGKEFDQWKVEGVWVE